MKSATVFAALALFAAAPTWAQVKPCEELKSEIEAKLTLKGVSGFTLNVVGKDAPDDGKVVGTCEGGTRKILYKRVG